MKVIRWTARILGFVASTFFLSFFIGEGVPDLKAGKADELIPFLPLFLFTVAGYFAVLVQHLFWWLGACYEGKICVRTLFN